MLVDPAHQEELCTRSSQRELARSNIHTSTTALRPKRLFTQGPYFYGQTIKDKRPRGHCTAWPPRLSP